MTQIRAHNERRLVGLKFAVVALLAALIFVTAITKVSISAGITLGDQSSFYSNQEGKVVFPVNGAEPGQMFAVFQQRNGYKAVFIAGNVIMGDRVEVVSDEFKNARNRTYHVVVFNEGVNPADYDELDLRNYDEHKDVLAMEPTQVSVSLDTAGPYLSGGMTVSPASGADRAKYSEDFYIVFQLTDAGSGLSPDSLNADGSGVILSKSYGIDPIQATSVEMLGDSGQTVTYRATYRVRDLIDEGYSATSISLTSHYLSVTAADILGNQNTTQSRIGGSLGYSRDATIEESYKAYRNEHAITSNSVTDGDELIVTIESDKAMYFTETSVVGAGNSSGRGSAEVIDQSGVTNEETGLTDWTYTLRYVFDQNDGWQESANVDLVLRYNVSPTGGESSTYQASTGYVFFESIIPSGFTVKSNGNIQASTFYVRDGDVVEYSFNTNHASEITGAKVAGTDVETESNEELTTHTLTYTVDGSALSDNEALSLEVVLQDDADNMTTVTHEEFHTPVYYGDIGVTAINFTSNNANNQQLAKLGDTVTLTIETNHPVSIRKASLEDHVFTYSSVTSNELTLTYTFREEEEIKDYSILSFEVELQDAAGNTMTVTQEKLQKEQNIRYYGPLGIENIKMYSSNKNAAVAANGDTITVEFTTQHPAIISNAIIGGKEAAVSSDDNDGMNWKLTYVVENGCLPDNTDFTFSMVVDDEAGNGPVGIDSEVTGHEGSVTYYAPISVDNLAMKTNNANNPNLAKNGDTLTLTFKTTHPVEVGKAVIAGKNVTFTSSDQMNWVATYTMENDAVADNAAIDFSFTVNDAAGNRAVTATQSGLDYEVRYYAPIKINNLQFVSENAQGSTLARDGDTVVLTFSTTHPIEVSGGKIAEKDVAFESEDGMNWTASYTLQNGSVADQQAVTFVFVSSDEAGNEPVTTSNANLEEQVIYYAPIQITQTKIVSSNGVDGSKYAKDDDVVTVTFKTNHPVSVTNAAIAGISVQFESEDGMNWTGQYTVRNGHIEDLALVSFQFTVNDAAGNDPISKDYLNGDVENRIQYFAPIRANSSIASSGKNKEYAKNGDKISISLDANHNIYVQSAQLLGRAITVSKSENTKLTTEYTIPENESSLKEGNVSFQITALDAAGNVFTFEEASDGSKVTYDRTVPKAKLSPIFNGYTGQDFTVSVYLEDENLDPNGVNVILNGENVFNERDRAAMAGQKEYTKTIEITEERTHNLDVTVVDMAGNESEPGVTMKAILDKTGPQFNTVFELGKPMAFKSGFKLSDHIEIVEDHVRDVSCQLTDTDGVYDWDMDAPITSEGKKTVNILVQDMAGNSGSLNYDFYIDGTAPKVNALDGTTNTEVVEGNVENMFYNDMVLQIYLSELHIGNEEADHFTQILLLKDTDGNPENGELVMDILADATPDEDGVYSIPIEEQDTYYLLIKAEDDVGNKFENNYEFTVGQKGVLTAFYENKVLFYITMSIAIVAVAAGAVVFALHVRKKKIKKRWF